MLDAVGMLHRKCREHHVVMIKLENLEQSRRHPIQSRGASKRDRRPPRRTRTPKQERTPRASIEKIDFNKIKRISSMVVRMLDELQDMDLSVL